MELVIVGVISAGILLARVPTGLDNVRDISSWSYRWN